MDRVIEITKLYNEGLFTAREYLGRLMDCLDREWQAMPDFGSTEFADKLATSIELGAPK